MSTRYFVVSEIEDLNEFRHFFHKELSFTFLGYWRFLILFIIRHTKISDLICFNFLSMKSLKFFGSYFFDKLRKINLPGNDRKEHISHQKYFLNIVFFILFCFNKCLLPCPS